MANPEPSEKDVLNAEYNRLFEKKTQVDAALNNQKRSLALSSSYSKKYEQYIKVVISLVIGLLGYLAIQFLETAVPFIPGFIFDGLGVLLLAYVAYTFYTVFIEINTRSPTNYDELDLPPISASATVSDTQKLGMQKSGDIIGIGITSAAPGVGACSGETCCPGRYNQQTNLCAFTTIEGAYAELLSSKISHKNEIKPYDEIEFKI